MVHVQLSAPCQHIEKSPANGAGRATEGPKMPSVSETLPEAPGKAAGMVIVGVWKISVRWTGGHELVYQTLEHRASGSLLKFEGGELRTKVQQLTNIRRLLTRDGAGCKSDR